MRKRRQKRRQLVRVAATKRGNLPDDDDPLFDERELEF